MPKKQATLVLSKAVVPAERIERRIWLIRGQKVMLDSDLATLYQVQTFNLNKAVKRNPDRFPGDFMFRLTNREAEGLIFQIGISKRGGRGGRRHLPYAFTEQGVAMLSSVLNSKRAVQMNILIVRVFVRLREMLAGHKDLAQAVEELRRRQCDQGRRIDEIVVLIQRLVAPPERPRRRIGFASPQA